MFSPYYAWARRRKRASAADHCALNVALYERGRKRWAMTERGHRSVIRDRTSLAIGPSSVAWNGRALEIDVDERTAPFRTRIRGRVTVSPLRLESQVFELESRGRHCWYPIAPISDVEVVLEQPALRWRGQAYLDSNWGNEPLEVAFQRWTWSRSALGAKQTAVLYDAVRRRESDLSMALRFSADRDPEAFVPPPWASLRTTPVWRIRRHTRSDAPRHARVEETLEDTPFYARSVFSTNLLGTSSLGVHESLDLDRFRRPGVQLMLPFRMPRRA